MHTEHGSRSRVPPMARRYSARHPALARATASRMPRRGARQSREHARGPPRATRPPAVDNLDDEAPIMLRGSREAIAQREDVGVAAPDAVDDGRRGAAATTLMGSDASAGCAPSRSSSGGPAPPVTCPKVANVTPLRFARKARLSTGFSRGARRVGVSMRPHRRRQCAPTPRRERGVCCFHAQCNGDHPSLGAGFDGQ